MGNWLAAVLLAVSDPSAQPETAILLPSSSQPGLGSDLANDVSSMTRWSSAYADNQWWKVDLGTARKVDTVVVSAVVCTTPT